MADKKKQKLNRVGKAAQKWDETTGKFWDKQSEKLEGFEDEMTDDPEDTVVGPALATGSALLREFFLPEKYDPDAMKQGAAPGSKALKKAGKKVQKEGSEALRELLTPKSARIGSNKVREKALKDAGSEEVVRSKLRHKLRSDHTKDLQDELKKAIPDPKGQEKIDNLNPEEVKELYEKIKMGDTDIRSVFQKAKARQEAELAKQGPELKLESAYPHMKKK